MYIHAVGKSEHQQQNVIDRYDGLKYDLVRLQVDGRSRAIVNGKRYLLRPGDLLLCNVGDLYRLEIGNEEGDMLPSSDYFLIMTSDEAWMEEWWSRVKDVEMKHIGLDGRLKSIWQQIIYERRRIHDNNEEISGLLVKCLLLHLERLIRSDYSRSSSETVFANKIREYVEMNASELLSLSQIASHAGLSVSRASEIFKQVYRQPIIDYLIELRLAMAKEHIVFTTLSIDEISHQCGFQTYSYFNRAFRSRFKLSPSEYRKKFRDNLFNH